MVAEVALGVRIGIAPLLRGLPEKGDIQEVGLIGVNEVGLGRGDGRRHQGLLDGISMDAVVDLGEGALEAPAELEMVVFIVLETLELFDELEFELDGHPGGEFKSDVLVRVGAAVTSGGGDQPDGSGRLDPAFRGEDKTVQSRLLFNPIEFDCS